MNILLLGPRGQLGWELQRALAPLGRVLTAGRHVGDDLAADLADLSAVEHAVQAAQPGLIVNAAAYTAVDKAENDRDATYAINAEGPGVLAACARRLNVPLLHYSSDYVFDGSGNHARDETAATGPLNIYGSSKLAGEVAVRNSGCSHLIFRTSWVYAARGGNFARTMLKLAAEREQLKVINDQWGAPTGAELLADVSAHAAVRLLRQPELTGTYHCAAAGQTTWHAYASHVIEFARRHGQVLKLAPDAVLALPTSDYSTAARRPLNSRLNCDKLQSTFGLRLPPWQSGVDRMLSEVLGC